MGLRGAALYAMSCVVRVRCAAQERIRTAARFKLLMRSRAQPRLATAVGQTILSASSADFPVRQPLRRLQLPPSIATNSPAAVALALPLESARHRQARSLPYA
jgi:hypothetical protein